MKEKMKLSDLMNEFDINKCILYDMEDNIIPSDSNEKRLPRWTPIISISDKDKDGIRKVVLDCYEREGDIYSRWELEDYKKEKAYESLTAPFDRHMLLINEEDEDFYW